MALVGHNPSSLLHFRIVFWLLLEASLLFPSTGLFLTLQSPSKRPSAAQQVTFTSLGGFAGW